MIYGTRLKFLDRYTYHRALPSSTYVPGFVSCDDPNASSRYREPRRVTVEIDHIVIQFSPSVFPNPWCRLSPCTVCRCLHLPADFVSLDQQACYVQCFVLKHQLASRFPHHPACCHALRPQCCSVSSPHIGWWLAIEDPARQSMRCDCLRVAGDDVYPDRMSPSTYHHHMLGDFDFLTYRTEGQY